MNRFKRVLSITTIIILFLSVSCALARQTINEVDMMIGSPEAAEFAKYGNLDVSLFKGVPNITIPIYTLELKDFSLPIYLSYDAGGIKVDQIATSVGLGWSLHAGGQISAVTHAKSDVTNPRDEPNNLQTFDPNEWSPGGSSSAKADYDFAWDIFDPFTGGQPKNTKPDVYFFNYPGNSGKFLKKTQATFATVPYANHSISYNSGAFQITDEHGNIFKFEEMETTTTWSKNCTGDGSSINSSMIPDQAYTWHLTEIITINGDVIEFEYQTENSYTYEAQNVQQKYVAQGGNHFLCESTIQDTQCTVTRNVTPVNLKKIVHQRSGQEINFMYTTGRQDFGGRELDRIVLTKTTSSGIYDFKEFTLSQSYFQSSGGTSHEYKRLRLDSIQQAGMPAYTFEYNTSDFPHRLSYSQDVWGYYNGQFNSTLVPNGAGLTGAANRSVNTSMVGRWSLEKINWPTGGSTVLNMEADPAGGGLRVASIHDLDGLSGTTGLREYSYVRSTFQTPYFLDFYSYYVDDGDPFNPTFHQCHYNQYTASSVQPVNTLDGPDYGYTQVTIDFDTNGEQGRTVVEFSGGVSDLSGSGGYAGPLSWGRGEQLQQTHYRYTGSGFAPVQKTENTYTVHMNNTFNMWANPTEPHEQYIYGMDIKLQNPEYSNMWGQVLKPARFNVHKYKVISAWYHPDITYTYLYDPNDANSYVITSTEQEYNTTTTRLDALIEVNSDNTSRRTEYTYGVTGKPSKLTSVAVKDGSGAFLKKRWAVWDQAASGRQELRRIWDWTTGNPDTTTPSSNIAVQVQEIWPYDSDGNPEIITDGNGFTTNLSWSANGMHLSNIEQLNSGGANLMVQADYDNLGLIEALWDENNRKITFEYDDLNRLERSRNHAGSILEEYTYTLAGSGLSTSNMNRILTKQYTSGSSIRESTQYFDGLGRLVQSQSKNGSNSLVNGFIQFDAAGQEWRSWKAYPHPSSSTMSYDASGTTNAKSYYDGNPGPDANDRPFVETIYEASPLRRVFRINPEGVSSTTSGTLRYNYGVQQVGGHNAAWTEVTDESGKKTRTWTDGWGRTIRTTAGYSTVDAAETGFEYDELDQLKKVISPEGLQTVHQYNKRGLLSQKTTPDAGTVNYVYDKNGNLRYMRDANLAAANRYMAYSYDFAGRVIKEETCSGGIPSSLTASCSSSQQAITYTYDDGTVGSGVSFIVNNPLGRLTKVDFQGGYYLYSYNNDGNIERMYNKLDGLNARTITYQYNRLGEITEVEMDGDSHFWEYVYDDLGRLDSIKTNTISTTVADAEYGYWPAGMVLTEKLGNQMISYGFDARDRLTSINDVTSSGYPFSAAYTYLNNSNIDTVQYHQPSSPHAHKRYRYTHTYDNRNQLTQANYNYWNGSGWSNSSAFDLGSVSYDKDGNMTGKNHNNGPQSGSHTYSYTSNTNKVSSISRSGSGSLGFGYDANGNVTSLSGLGYSISSVSYDWRNLPLSMNAGGSRTYRYDHTGARVFKSYEGVHYLRGAYGEILAIYEGGSLAYWNILRPEGTVIGRRESGGTRRYYHRDHLGSTRAVVAAGGTVTETYDFMPFGMEMDRSLTGGLATRNKFTGHETDEEKQLIHMEWRGYLAEFGRFMSVDPLAGEFPGWSPYSYVFNNPLIFIDPTGEYPTCGDNCDEYYQEGSIVENQYGSWTYQGNNQWTDVSGNAVSGTDLLASFNQMLEGGFISQWEPSWADCWSESSNIFATLSYSLLNSPWVALQALNPFDNTVTHISGALATPREQLDAGVASAPIGYGVGKISGAARAGRELTFSSNFRIAPFGNRTGHSTGRFPHYHRRVLDDKGNVRPGGSMKRHRPWDTRSTDKSIWERF